jgi:predicted RNase H-like HicB family nuclease
MCHIEIRVELVREGVYLATCSQVPGLTVECSTRDDAMRIASDIAAELIAIERRKPFSRRPNLSFRFI